jgi:hypothetical protein
MGTTMDNSSCEWVRSRLPLYVGAADQAPDDPAGDGGDLGAGDRRAMGRHLTGCPECRAHRSGLAGALGALAATACVPPIPPDLPSLWPALERRIAAHPPGGDPATARGWEPAPAGPGPTWAALDDERPLDSAWIQDTLNEVAEAAGWPARPTRAAVSWRVVGVSLAASVLVLLVVLPVTWRLREVAAEKMLAYSRPVPALVGPPAPAAGEVDRGALAPEGDRDIPAGELAQADPIRPPAEPPPATDAARDRSGTSSRFGNDLELGIPMPPDGRDSKSVY